MMCMDAKRDENRVAGLIGVDDTGVIRQVLIDGVTGRLLLHQEQTNAVSPLSVQIAKRDENRVPNEMATDPSGNLKAILADSDGNLFINT